MLGKESINTIILAFLVYLPTCAFVPDYAYLLVLGYSLIANFSYVKNYILSLFNRKVTDSTLTYLIVFAVIAFVFRLADFENWSSFKSFYSFAYLFPFTYLVARTVWLNKKVYDFLVLFIAVESVVGILEYLAGKNSFFTSLNYYREFDSYNLLYYTRVFGLSVNSSIFSIKLFVGLIILNRTVFSEKIKFIFELLILGVSILAFGRIALIAIGVYYFIKAVDVFLVSKQFKKLTFLPFVLFVLFFATNPTWSKNQFTRNNKAVTAHFIGTEDEGYLTAEEMKDVEFDLTEKLGIGKINMSGRNQIWNTFVKFGIKNIFVGNKSEKFMLGKVHAHNSYIEVFASFGIVMTTFLFFIFFRAVNRQNYVVVLSLMILAIGQYFIFWGISFYDIIFYSLLFFDQVPVRHEVE
ncbi:MAG: hypothetical protein AB8B72_12450 [Crocinitomicaceae bacterium]